MDNHAQCLLVIDELDFTSDDDRMDESMAGLSIWEMFVTEMMGVDELGLEGYNRPDTKMFGFCRLHHAFFV
jgi:hypothetical protein